MTFTKWLKRNKEGAIVGGVIGGIYGLLSTISYLMDGIARSNAERIINITGISGEEVVYIGIGFFLILGALIGALIDSKWRPLR